VPVSDHNARVSGSGSISGSGSGSARVSVTGSGSDRVDDGRPSLRRASHRDLVACHPGRASDGGLFTHPRHPERGADGVGAESKGPWNALALARTLLPSPAVCEPQTLRLARCAHSLRVTGRTRDASSLGVTGRGGRNGCRRVASRLAAPLVRIVSGHGYGHGPGQGHGHGHGHGHGYGDGHGDGAHRARARKRARARDDERPATSDQRREATRRERERERDRERATALIGSGSGG
jgi:hypothetical protein